MPWRFEYRKPFVYSPPERLAIETTLLAVSSALKLSGEDLWSHLEAAAEHYFDARAIARGSDAPKYNEIKQSLSSLMKTCKRLEETIRDLDDLTISAMLRHGGPFTKRWYSMRGSPEKRLNTLIGNAGLPLLRKRAEVAIDHLSEDNTNIRYLMNLTFSAPLSYDGNRRTNPHRSLADLLAVVFRRTTGKKPTCNRKPKGRSSPRSHVGNFVEFYLACLEPIPDMGVMTEKALLNYAREAIQARWPQRTMG